MATDFSNKTSMSSPLTVGSKKVNDMPLDIRTRLETLEEIDKVEYPYIGMMFYVKETDKYYSVKSLKSEELIPGVAATAIKNYRIGDYEEFEADSSVEEDILVSGVDNLGGLMEGQVIPAGTTFTEFLKMLLQKPEEFEYDLPEVFIEPNPYELEQEVGTAIMPKLGFSFDKNDGGEILEVEFGPVNGLQQPEAIIQDEDNVEYSVKVSYAEGPQKFDDFGNPVGRPVPAGVVEDKVCYKGFRYFFFGADKGTETCESGEVIRKLKKTREKEFSVKVPAGSQRIMIAVPVNGPQPTDIDYNEQGGVEYKSVFIPNMVDVSGATPGENMMAYNVYTYIFAIPCGMAMTFDVKLA